MNNDNIRVEYRKIVQNTVNQIQKLSVKSFKSNTLEGSIRDLMHTNISDYQTPIKKVVFSDGTETDYSQRNCLQEEKILENSIQFINDIGKELAPDWSITYRITSGFDSAPELYVIVSKNYYKEQKVFAALCGLKKEGMEIAKNAGILEDIDIHDFGWQHMMNRINDIYKYGKRLLEVVGLNLDDVCEILDATDLKPFLVELIEENVSLTDVSLFVAKYLRRPFRPNIDKDFESNYEGETSNEG